MRSGRTLCYASLSDSISLYIDAVADYNLAPTEQPRYLQHLFNGDTQRNYDRQVSGRASTLADAILFMKQEF
jgi:hypothetical protein